MLKRLRSTVETMVFVTLTQTSQGKLIRSLSNPIRYTALPQCPGLGTAPGWIKTNAICVLFGEIKTSRGTRVKCRFRYRAWLWETCVITADILKPMSFNERNHKTKNTAQFDTQLLHPKVLRGSWQQRISLSGKNYFLSVWNKTANYPKNTFLISEQVTE